MTKQIKVTIDPMGNPKVEALGFSGTSCEAATAPIEDALAGKPGAGDRTYKPEYSESNQTEVQQGW